VLSASIERLVQATGGELLTGDIATVVTDLVVDSRSVTPGCVFVAVVGENSDGHDFATAAIESGARAVIVTRPSMELAPALDAAKAADAAVIRVDDAIASVQDIAAWHRSRLRCAVVGITGSTGKTTTKDFLANAFPADTVVVSTQGNRNNELGVPLTVLSAGGDCDVLIVEMGMRGPGQIARLTQIAKPTVGLVTNVGTSHIELLGTQDSIASAKGELVRAVPEDGAVFLNGDDAYTDSLALSATAPVTRYGMGHKNEVRAESVELDADSVATFTLLAPSGEASMKLPVPGRHNVYNALAAAAVALHLGVPAATVAEGISHAKLTAMRMEIVETARGVTVVNDAYNANPTSMRAAIDTLARMSVSGKKIAVLGDMLELGSLSELAHFGVGEEVAKLDIDVLVTVGESAVRIADGARAEGMPAERIRPCGTVAEAIEVLDDVIEIGDVVLVKASRAMGFEAVVEGIVSPRV
jgi:UDP-N-acetylmuramoyl-tripeptide--D-alanyl-D-alanine ligase